MKLTLSVPIQITTKFTSNISANDYADLAELYDNYCKDLYQKGVVFLSSFTRIGLSITIPKQVISVHKNNYMNLVKTLHSA